VRPGAGGRAARPRRGGRPRALTVARPQAPGLQPGGFAAAQPERKVLAAYVSPQFSQRPQAASCAGVRTTYGLPPVLSAPHGFRRVMEVTLPKASRLTQVT